MLAPGSTNRKIDKLIHLLVKNATVVVPGPKIASEIGVTRSTVWTWIEKLRSLGVEIRGVPAAGYRLVNIPDLLAPAPCGRNWASLRSATTSFTTFEPNRPTMWR